MENTIDFKSFRKMKKGTSLIAEDVVAIGEAFRVRGFDVPKSLIGSFKKKAKDSGHDIAGKFADTELAEFIAKYIATKFLTIDNLPLDVLGDEYAGVTVQTQPVQMQTQTQVQTPDGQNVQAQATAQEIPAQEVQGQGAIQGQGQTQGQGATQGQTTQGGTPTQEI